MEQPISGNALRIAANAATMFAVRIDLRDRDAQYLFRIKIDPRKPPSIVHPPDAVVTASNAPNSGDESPAPATTAASTSTGVPAAAPGDNAAKGREVLLIWDGAFDDQQHLRRCPACGCRELFVRKDFPQITGLVIVLMAAVLAVALFGNQLVIYGFLLLGAAAVIDAIIFFFVGKCLVCYRCRSEFRDTPIRPDHPGWELATGEKYRQAAKQE